jgi:hypothetical protein
MKDLWGPPVAGLKWPSWAVAGLGLVIFFGLNGSGVGTIWSGVIALAAEAVIVLLLVLLVHIAGRDHR